MSIDWVCPFDTHERTHPYVKDNSTYYPHFKDCIGAIDGTHVKAIVPEEMKIPFIGRKGTPTQNVLAVCDFDLCFTYVLPGWDGSAHDTRIFYNTIRDHNKKFPMPPSGKYYLVDAGYPNIPGFLAPYKGHRYHLPDFRRSSRYNNHYEAFNHIHSSLRMCIERSFGVWKAKWAILDKMPVGIPFADQVALVPATMALNNFIRRHDALDDDFLRFKDYEPAQFTRMTSQDQNNDINMNKVRDNICASITFSRIGVSMF